MGSIRQNSYRTSSGAHNDCKVLLDMLSYWDSDFYMDGFSPRFQSITSGNYQFYILNIIYKYIHKIQRKIMAQLSHFTSHSAYAATETELVVAKIGGLLPPNFL